MSRVCLVLHNIVERMSKNPYCTHTLMRIDVLAHRSRDNVGTRPG